MRYTLHPGNVAAMLHVTKDNFEFYDCIFIAENRAVEVWPNRTVEIFPVAVRAAINKHFGTLFSLPVERRGAYIKSLVAWEVEA